jgi:hypothetical protein
MEVYGEGQGPSWVLGLFVPFGKCSSSWVRVILSEANSNTTIEHI